MAATVKLLFALLLLCMLTEGKSQKCDLSSIVVSEINTGKMSGFDFVFEVEVKNLCHCTVVNVMLSSMGFSSTTPVEPNLFRRTNYGYLINDGKGIASSQSFKFQYSWDHYFHMAPKSFHVACD